MSTYRERLLEEIEQSRKEQAESSRIFLDASRSEDERLAAAENLAPLQEEAEVETALALVRNVDESDAMRAIALHRLVDVVGHDEDLLQYTVELVAGSDVPADLRNSAAMVLQTMRFSSPLYAAHRPAIQAALRSAVDHENEALRSACIEYLAIDKDEYVQRRLLEGLQDEKQELVKPEVAVQLLAYDLHADHYPVLRHLAEHPPNPRCQQEALRHLGTDPEAKDLLLQTLREKKEDPETRHICAVAL
ncbi:MAG: hypothetical protein AAF492_22470, partial [Verrucomicrobiota bacterium]